MTTFGITLSSEEHSARRLVAIARAADAQGFHEFAISDHLHPWIDEQGQSPAVWPVIGAVSSAVPGASIGTAVTCPTFRFHPLLVAQAAATAQELTEGRFFLGVGSGENLNEHVIGPPWPQVEIRHERLREAVALIRAFWQGGNQSWQGRHFAVDQARLYSLPDQPPPIYVSAFGPEATDLAAEIGDGYVNTSPDGGALERFRQSNNGRAVSCAKCCWAPTEAAARETVHRLWPTSGLPGQLAQELKTPQLFEQACELVDEEAAVGGVPCGPDPAVHAQALQRYVDAGYDSVFVQQIGPEQEEFLRFYRDQVLPHVPGLTVVPKAEAASPSPADAA